MQEEKETAVEQEITTIAKGAGIVFFSTLIGGIIFFYAQVLAGDFFHKPGLESIIKIIAITIPFTTLTTILVFSSQGFKIVKYKMYVRELIEPILRMFRFSYSGRMSLYTASICTATSCQDGLSFISWSDDFAIAAVLSGLSIR